MSMSYPGAPGDGAYLAVQVATVRELLYDEGTQVVQQRVLVHRVFHLWHTLEELNAEGSDL